MDKVETIRVTDFTRFPGGRLKKHGPGSGEEFRERYLLPKVRRQQRIRVVLAGAYGYPISFLEEAFAGLVREGHPPAVLRKLLRIEAGESGFEPYVRTIWALIDEQGEIEPIAHSA